MPPGCEGIGCLSSSGKNMEEIKEHVMSSWLVGELSVGETVQRAGQSRKTGLGAGVRQSDRKEKDSANSRGSKITKVGFKHITVHQKAWPQRVALAWADALHREIELQWSPNLKAQQDYQVEGFCNGCTQSLWVPSAGEGHWADVTTVDPWAALRKFVAPRFPPSLDCAFCPLIPQWGPLRRCSLERAKCCWDHLDSPHH